MSWLTGQDLSEDLWSAIYPYLMDLPSVTVEEIAKEIVRVMEEYDCDAMDGTTVCQIAYPEGRFDSDEEDL